MMKISVDERLCKGCELCIYFCPKEVFSMSDKINQKGYNVVGVIDPEQCTGCKLCEINCPDLALHIC